MQEFFETLGEYLTEYSQIRLVAIQFIPSLFSWVVYVFQGLYLTFLCRASRKGQVWMAWVPFANLYLLGLQADVYTDDRVLRGEISPSYAPSTLRRKMLVFSIAEKILEAVTAVTACVALLLGFAGILVAVFGGLLEDSENIENGENMIGVFGACLLIALVAGAAFLLFHILYLVSACKAHYRLFDMLGAPVPALWSAALIFLPALATVMLFVFTVKNYRVLTEKFFPPMEPMETTADEAADGETPPPDEPPMPELYQL